MDSETINQLMDVMQSLPGYAYIILFIFIMFIFGKKKDWEYEAKLFAENQTTMIGEFEIKKYKNEAPEGELELTNLEKYYNQDIEILVGNDSIQKLRINSEGSHYDILYPRLERKTNDIHRTSSARRFNKLYLYFDEHINLQNNQKVVIRVLNEDVATGTLLPD